MKPITDLDTRLHGVVERWSSNPLVSKPSVHVVNDELGVEIGIGSTGSHFIASATKPMLAFALVRALTENGLTPDVLVRDIISDEFRGVPNADVITVRHLLAHTSGMYNYWDEHGLASHKGPEPLLEWAHNHPGWDVDEVLRLVRANSPKAAPGAKVSYNGTNYQIASLLLERITSRPLDAALSQLVFEPAEMSDSVLFTAQNLERFDSVELIKYGTGTYTAARRMASLGGEGGVISTTRDTNKFLELMLNTPTTTDLMREQSQQFAPGIHYGLGLMQARVPRFMTGLRRTTRFEGHLGMTGYAMFSAPETGWRISSTVNQMEKTVVGVRLFADIVSAISRHHRI